MIKRYSNHKKRPNNNRVFVTANHHINYPELRVMDERGEALGIMTKAAALQAAEQAEKDLVLVTDKATPPVAKIIDLSKYKYQLSQKQAEARKKANVQDTKEVRLTPFIGENDLASKTKKIRDFLKHGDKVRLSMEFRGRAITHQDLGREVFAQVFEAVGDLGVIEIDIKLLGKKMMAQIMPSKKS